MVNGRPMLLLSGEVHNSAASSLREMEDIWDKAVKNNLNSLIVPVYWELTESEEGKFDFTLVDGLLRGARLHGLKLVLLWFGTWKNTLSTYVPGWVKKTTEKYFRAEDAEGNKLRAISVFCDEAREADKRAYCALLSYLAEKDNKEKTVVAIQVENEVGILGTPRDYCTKANKAFEAEVPEALTDYIIKNDGKIRHEICDAYKSGSGKGSWKEVFGNKAEEYFMAYNFAQYIGEIAECGKKIYELPTAVNAWLVQYKDQPRGKYPSGGPVADVIDIWKAAQNAIDVFTPDIYLPTFKEVCDEYAVNGNQLFIPETSNRAVAPAGVYYAIGEHKAACYAPFAVEDIDSDSLAKNYALLTKISFFLQDAYVKCEKGEGFMHGFMNEGSVVTFEDDGYKFTIGYPEKEKFSGAGLVLKMNEDEYLFAGFGYRADVTAVDCGTDKKTADFISIEDVSLTFDFRRFSFSFKPIKRLNGDEESITLKEPGLRLVKLYKY